MPAADKVIPRKMGNLGNSGIWSVAFSQLQ